jgi:hypothetical protein
MRTLLKLTLISALAGVALGAAVAYVEVRPWAVVDVREIKEDAAESPAAEAKLPRAEFPETAYNFGNMERGATLKHAFQVRNTGDAPLTVKVINTTCKCTVGDLAKNELAPGEESDILLEWTAKTPAGPFRHGATIGTNDPRQSRVELVVEGDVVESSSVVPAELVFSNVPVGQSATAYVYVISNLQPEVKVLNYKFSDEQMAQQFQVDITPAKKDELPIPGAMAGVKVTATYQAGNTIGQSLGWLELTTDLEKSPKLSVLVVTSVVGDISVYGPGWVPRLGLLNLGSAYSNSGKRVRLNLAVRGEHAATTEVGVVKTDPDFLRVTLGERQQMGETLAHIPLFVEIPKGSPPMVRTGEPASTDALIVLKSNHPNASEIQLRVHFTVEQ